MMPDSKKPNWLLWTTGVLLPVLYVASLLPIGWLGNRGMIPEGFAMSAMRTYVAPVQWAYENGPDPLKMAIKRLDEATMP